MRYFLRLSMNTNEGLSLIGFSPEVISSLSPYFFGCIFAILHFLASTINLDLFITL